MSKSKILLQITGSIAAYKACELLSTLVKSNYEVKVVASKNALRFIGEATLEGLSGTAVYTDLWESGRLMDHIELNRWADLIIVAPASASYINRVATGTGEDLLTTLFLAHDFKKPFLIAPAMNQSMYNHPITQKSLVALQELGIILLNPEEGPLACGETGPGRLMEPAHIFSQIEKELAVAKKLADFAKNSSAETSNNRGKAQRKILITAGGTSEPIDDVRVLTNKSTGATGAIIADSLIKEGFEITFLSSENSIRPKLPCQQIQFISFQDLQKKLKYELQQQYSAVVHAAAVSDYSPRAHMGKLSSDTEVLPLELNKNPKLINELRNWSINKELKLIAFKLTSTSSSDEQKNAVKKLAKDSSADLIIQNDFSQFNKNPGSHAFNAYQNNQLIFEANNKLDLGQKILKYLQENLL